MTELQIRELDDGRLALVELKVIKHLHPVEAQGLVNRQEAVDRTGRFPAILIGEIL